MTKFVNLIIENPILNKNFWANILMSKTVEFLFIQNYLKFLGKH